MTDDDNLTPVSALRSLAIAAPIWARESPEIGFTSTGAREWRYRCKFLSTSALMPIAWLLADGWHVTIDRATRGLVVRFSKS